jgi:hypothetical protein
MMTHSSLSAILILYLIGLSVAFALLPSSSTRSLVNLNINTNRHPISSCSNRYSSSKSIGRGLSLYAGAWGNYSSDGKTEGLIILALSLALTLRTTFISVDLRTTCSCPSGTY